MLLAIDPGTTSSAYILYEHEMIFGKGKVENEAMLDIIRDTIFDTLVVEAIASFGMSVGAEVFTTCIWVGRFIQVCADKGRAGSPYALMYRGEIKMHLCHSMRAKDSNIRQALIDRLGKPGSKKNPGPTYGISGDEWSALAVAVTFSDTKGAK